MRTGGGMVIRKNQRHEFLFTKIKPLNYFFPYNFIINTLIPYDLTWPLKESLWTRAISYPEHKD